MEFFFRCLKVILLLSCGLLSLAFFSSLCLMHESEGVWVPCSKGPLEYSKATTQQPFETPGDGRLTFLMMC